MENEKTKKMENAAAASRAEQNTAAYGAAAKDMAKTYDPKAFEDRIYADWRKTAHSVQRLIQRKSRSRL